MAQYRNAVMTQNGAALLNKAQAGLCKIKFTRMSTGDGQYSESEKGIEELRKITSLKSHKQSFSFDSIKYQDDTSVELKASITNHDDTQTLSAGYYIREIAVFAQEDDKSDTEVLYSISVADVADFLPTYNGNNPILIIQKYYVTVDESRSAITVPSHYGEDLDAVKEDLEKEWKEYAKNIDEEMKKRPEKDGKADEMTVTFTEAANRENIVTGEKNSTLMGKIKKWLADLAAAAFMQVVTSYSDLMAGTALDDYLIGAAAAKEGFTELNGKLTWTDWKKLTTDQPQISIYYRYNSITTEIKVENGTYTTPSTSLEIEIAQLPLNLCPLQMIYLAGTEGLQLRIESEGLLKIKCPNIYGRGYISYGNRITN